ncbi:uncharacterized protein LOC128863390 [Anastrepha ludens]|uniref:uncharacterized protein LOC128863390 n=1 Tax=Anastrepha ludens TaxID=28586 RepID=UPI0023AE7AC0|nr:uncharacterized protein LOC128863390 [Anastrepha ludens]
MNWMFLWIGKNSSTFAVFQLLTYISEFATGMHKVKLTVESEVWTRKSLKQRNITQRNFETRAKLKSHCVLKDIDGYQKSTLATNDYDDFILNTVEMHIPYCIKMFA